MHTAISALDNAVAPDGDISLSDKRGVRHKGYPAFKRDRRAAINSSRLDDGSVVRISLRVAILSGSRRTEVRDFHGCGAACFLVIHEMHAVIRAGHSIAAGI